MIVPNMIAAAALAAVMVGPAPSFVDSVVLPPSSVATPLEASESSRQSPPCERHRTRTRRVIYQDHDPT